MAASFVKPWTSLLSPDAPIGPLVPTLDVLFTSVDGRLRLETFLVDSGADISLAPRQLCEELGLAWETGIPIDLYGISPKPECVVSARILEVDFIVPDIGAAIRLPLCFADGDASQLLGREGFFDCFRLTFDKRQLHTKFELVQVPEQT